MAILCLRSLSTLADTRPKLVLGINDLPAYRTLHQEIYQKVNKDSEKFQFELQPFPNRRAFIAANDGLVDGVAVKPEPEFEAEFKNLIRIKTPLYEANAIVAIPHDAPDIADEKNLALHHVAMINGAVHAMNRVPLEKRVFVNSHLSGLLMVAHGRVPAMLTLDIPYYMAVRESRDVARKTRLASLKNKVPFYMYVHKKHRDMVGELEALLDKITASGATQKIYDQVVHDLTPSQPKN
jgi:ABC-type amino acid transport substrate-binding protein